MAMVSIMDNVFCDDAALYKVRLYWGLGCEITILGNRPIANSVKRAAILAPDDKNAKKSFPLFISRGILAIARMFNKATMNSTGYSLK